VLGRLARIEQRGQAVQAERFRDRRDDQAEVIREHVGAAHVNGPPRALRGGGAGAPGAGAAPGGGAQHEVTGFRRHVRLVIEDPGHGRDGHAGLRGDVAHGHPAPARPVGDQDLLRCFIAAA